MWGSRMGRARSGEQVGSGESGPRGSWEQEDLKPSWGVGGEQGVGVQAAPALLEFLLPLGTMVRTTVHTLAALHPRRACTSWGKASRHCLDLDTTSTSGLSGQGGVQVLRTEQSGR